MEIIFVTKGLLSVQFKNSQEEVYKSIGKPNQIWHNDCGSLIWGYFDRKIVLHFQKQLDMQLGWISVFDESANLSFMESTWSLTIEEIIENMKSEYSLPYEHEFYHGSDKLYYGELELEFQFILGSLSCINLGVMNTNSS